MKSVKSKLIIDIGAKNIKILEVKEEANDFEVLNHLIVEIPSDIYEDGLISNTYQMSQLISNALSNKKINTRTAVTTITSSQILSREVLLPKVGLKEMNQLIKLEAPNHFPIDISDHHIDFKVLEEVVENELAQYKIIILVTPTKIIRSYVELFEKCGIYLEKIDFQGNSISKLIRQLEEIKLFETVKTNVVLDIGCNSSSITIEHAGLIKYNRTVPFGSSLYNKELISILGCSEEEAETIKIFTGIISDEVENDPFKIAAKQAWVKLSVPLFDEVSRVLEFFSSRKDTNSIDRILLTGGGAQITNLLKYMHNSFDMQIEFLNCDGIVEFASPMTDIENFSAYYSNCLGALFS